MSANDNEGCVCGHGGYNHGDGYTFVGRFLGHHSRCIRCNCTKFERAPASPSTGLREADNG